MTTPSTISPHPSPTNTPSTHLHYLRACLSLASQSPPKPTNFRVGAILLSRNPSSPSETTTYTDQFLSTGYTLELPGNTHAEQCALSKYTAAHNVLEDKIGEVLPPPDTPSTAQVIMYVTMEPCGKRLSGNAPCVQRIIQTRNGNGGRRRAGIDKVYFGVKEPGTFVGESVGCKMLSEAGVEWEVVEGLEEEILGVAMAGHEKEKGGEEAEGKSKEGSRVGGTNVDDISEEERRRQEARPRNPKKRMMEADI
ncbi:hypothetical protein AJ79_05919 [Helicocarpus griseus UAMH5409]|uniref:CMP/dCMP-type deaminase domain-containing protein n=1 Tax=Helicocarpus griseus UAMH5409 TaxID=1447875 RepID=A0A2B7XJB7_9EURO|nr:hypothetical protein AJ79_05919 [Helicocarpus griseus UAMH5409]